MKMLREHKMLTGVAILAVAALIMGIVAVAMLSNRLKDDDNVIKNNHVSDGVINTAELADLAVTGAKMNYESGITSGAGWASTGDAPTMKVYNRGADIITVITFDLQGLNSGGTNEDIVGLTGGGASYLAQLTEAKNGVITAAALLCREATAGGDADIDLYQSSTATLAEDDVSSGGHVLLASVSSVATTVREASTTYLYITSQTTDATYTAGKFTAILYGMPV